MPSRSSSATGTRGGSGFWDFFFFLGSLVPAMLVGVALGNVIRGIPLNENGDYTGTFLELLNPYSLLVGVTGLVLLVTHGASWLAVKAEGPCTSVPSSGARRCSSSASCSPW